MMYSTQDKSEAVLYMWKTEHFQDQRLPKVKLAGLDPDRLYTITELNKAVNGRPYMLEGKSFSGDYLMNVGIDMPQGGTNAYHSRVLRLKAE